LYGPLILKFLLFLTYKCDTQKITKKEEISYIDDIKS